MKGDLIFEKELYTKNFTGSQKKAEEEIEVPDSLLDEIAAEIQEAELVF